MNENNILSTGGGEMRKEIYICPLTRGVHFLEVRAGAKSRCYIATKTSFERLMRWLSSHPEEIVKVRNYTGAIEYTVESRAR